MTRKKIVLMLVALSMLVLCTACQSKEARALDASIKAIGKVSLASESVIENLEEEYNSLSAEDRESLKYADLLADARKTLTVLQVIDKIDALPQHAYLEIKGDLDAIGELYDTLPEGRKSEVTNYDKLESAYDSWYSVAYNEAERLYADSKYKEAYEYYLMLPAGYQDSDSRIKDLEVIIEEGEKRLSVLGTWVWDGNYSDASDGQSYAADFASLTFSESEYFSIYDERMSIDYAADIVPEDIVQSSLMHHLMGAHDFIESGSISNIDFGSDTWDEILETPKDDILIASNGFYSRTAAYVYKLILYFHFQEDGRLRIQYRLTEMHSGLGEPKNTEVEFYFDKK